MNIIDYLFLVKNFQDLLFYVWRIVKWELFMKIHLKPMKNGKAK